MIRIPYELNEAIFGSWVAENFNTICGCLCAIGFIVYILGGNRRR